MDTKAKLEYVRKQLEKFNSAKLRKLEQLLLTELKNEQN